MPNDQHLIEEGNVPGSWEPVESNPVVPGRAGSPAIFNPNAMPQFFSGSLAPQLQHDTSFVGTEVGTPRIPKFSLMPFGNQASAFTNAAAESTIIKTGGSGGGSSSATGTVTLDVPSIFLPLAQTSNLPNAKLVITLAPEPVRTVFASAPQGAAVVDNGVGLSALDVSITVSAQSQNSNDLGMLFLVSDTFHSATAPTVPTGWSTISASGDSLVLRMDNVGIGQITAASSYTTANANYKSISAFLLTLGVQTATTPVITTRANGGGAFGTLNIGAGAGVVINGEALVAVVMGGRSFQSSFSGYNTVTDNHGNTWALVNQTFAHTEYVPDTNFYGTSIAVWVCTDPVPATDYTWTFSTVGGLTSGANAYVFGITNLMALSGVPYFRLLTQPDIPSINLAVDAGGSGDFQGVYGNLDTTHLDSGTNALQSTVFFGTSPDGEWKQPSNTLVAVSGTTASYTTQPDDPGQTLVVTSLPGGGEVDIVLSNNFWGWITNQAFSSGGSPSQTIVKISTLSNKDSFGNTVSFVKISLGQTVYISSGPAGFIASGIGNGIQPAGLPLSFELNGIGVSADKQFFFNGLTDGTTLWKITVNGTPDGG